MFTPKLVKTMDFSGLKKLQKQSPEMFKKSMSKGGLQFLNWANNGSGKEKRKPPIRWGVLRGSSSAFIGNELIGVFDIRIKSGATEEATPARQHTGNPMTLTFAWNTDYAKKMHEWEGGWGEFTQQDGDAGNKWLELHLVKDRDDLYEFIKGDFIDAMENM